MNIVIVPYFKRKLKKLSKDHLKIIWNKIKKLKEQGLNAVKILYVLGNYVLGEIKTNNPPYRLYIIFNQESKTFYIIEWEHKKKQEQIINKLKEKIKEVLREGTDIISFFE